MKKVKLPEPNQSWLHGKYPNLKSEINTSFPYVSIETETESYFWQGEEAQKVIDEIYDFWLLHNCTAEQAVKVWINSYL